MSDETTIQDQIFHTHVPGMPEAPVTLRAFRATYESTGAPAIVLWPCDGEGRLTSDEEWCTATVNGVGPDRDGILALDANGMGPALTGCLMSSPHLDDTGCTASSGYCAYPLVRADADWLAALTDCTDDDAMAPVWAEASLGD